MIHKSVTVEVPGSAYRLVFTSDPGSVFLKILVKEVGGEEGKAVMAALVKWDNFKTLKVYGRSQVKHFALILGTIERELASLLHDTARTEAIFLH